MRLGYLRWIDKYIGIPLCSLIFIKECFCNSFNNILRRRLQKRPVRKIIVIKFWGFGSIVLAAEAFQRLRDNFPQTCLAVFTLTQNRPIYEMLNIFDEIIDVDLKSIPAFLSRTIKYLRQIRNRGFELALDFEFTSRFTAIVTYLTGAGQRVGFKYAHLWRGSGYTDEVEFREDRKIRSSFLNLVQRVAPQASGVRPPLHIQQRDCVYVDELFGRQRLAGNRPLVGMNINASELSLLRRWPREYFTALSEELIKKYQAQIFFVGDAADAKYVAETITTIAQKENVHNLAGKTTLAQLAYLLSRLDLFISNDSGPLHLAAYLPIPTVSFFGPESPFIYGPEGPGHILFYRHLDCSPCIRVQNYKYSRCLYHQRCLRAITPRQVISEIERCGLLREPQGRAAGKGRNIKVV